MFCQGFAKSNRWSSVLGSNFAAARPRNPNGRNGSNAAISEFAESAVLQAANHPKPNRDRLFLNVSYSALPRNFTNFTRNGAAP
jgi:hypothetical protein